MSTALGEAWLTVVSFHFPHFHYVEMRFVELETFHFRCYFLFPVCFSFVRVVCDFPHFPRRFPEGVGNVLCLNSFLQAHIPAPSPIFEKKGSTPLLKWVNEFSPFNLFFY